MPSLAARLDASKSKAAQADNMLPPFGVARVLFTNPPQSARDVVVRIIERVKLYEGNHPYRQMGRFIGEFKAGKFVVHRMVGAPPRDKNQISVHIIAGEGAEKGHFVGLAPDPRDVIRHTLTLEVEAPGYQTFKGGHPLHIGNPGVAIVFYEGNSPSFHSYAAQIASSVRGKKLTVAGQVQQGPWQFFSAASVVNQIKAFHVKTDVKASEVHVVGHTNNGLDFDSPKESQELAKHATADIKIVWHGCYACNYFNATRQKAFFANIPTGTVNGHRDIKVDAGMPYAFRRIRNQQEVLVQRVTDEVVPESYVRWWADQQNRAQLQKALNHPEAEVDVKAIVEEELDSRP